MKSKSSLRTVTEATKLVVRDSVTHTTEPLLRPEFVKKMGLIQKQKSIPVDDFLEQYALKIGRKINDSLYEQYKKRMRKM